MEQKDPSVKHFRISMVKSAVRIAGFIALCTGNLLVAGLIPVSYTHLTLPTRRIV